MANLTHKQQAFVDEYLIDLNATQAAIRAGYSKRTAKQIGTENLAKPDISRAIKERMDEKESKLIAKQDEVLRLLTATARREEKESVVVTIKKSVSKWVDGKKQTVEEEEPKIVEIPAKLMDANKARELLGKYYALWTDKQQLDAKIQIDPASAVIAAAQKREADVTDDG